MSAKSMNTPKELGKMIRILRKKQGITQEELAKRLGLARATIGYYEVGRNNFTVETLERVIDALGHKLNIQIEVK
ncbi:helix-turn-helix transcriptional regulator [Spirosoma sp. KCTC 42546]|uniref:helix-turn-helix domain-containing protein n=1 Tax=Spirosoma sp. KCTC 42546 TaxID=2520506 RepID=UPI00115A4931|nr:helix-turn-helix transcriptional regulator [Spirosoma sp. KCTC 42546]QDK81569.1 helix-turn-helix transcriptional regulator [Spirosoma sp. KCTC 42546]